MSMETDLASMSAVTKELYDGQLVSDEIFMRNKFFMMLAKHEDFVGNPWPIPMAIGTGQGISTTFSDSQGYSTPAIYDRFSLTRTRKYGTAVIDRETRLAVVQSKGSFVDTVKDTLGKKIQGVVNRLAYEAFRGTTGTLGFISTITTGVIVLTQQSDQRGFEVDMFLQCNATSGGATPLPTGAWIVAVNKVAGTVTVSLTQGGVPASPLNWQAGYALLAVGDNNGALAGVSAWIPPEGSRPVAGQTFFGVDRSVDPLRLAGYAADLSQSNFEEALINAATQLSAYEGNPDYAWVTPTTWGALAMSVDAKRIISADTDRAGISVKAIEYYGPEGIIKVVSDPNVPAQRCMLLQMDTWGLKSLEAAPHLQVDEGLTWWRGATADNAEARVSFYGNVYCNSPMKNGNFKTQV